MFLDLEGIAESLRKQFLVIGDLAELAAQARGHGLTVQTGS
jgi:hypothetical protein